jgi:hypothetical protein
MQQETRGTSPIDNLTYDLITVIQAKAEGLAAFDKYMQDAQGNQQATQLFQQIRQQDSQYIQQLLQCLQSVQSGTTSGVSS